MDNSILFHNVLDDEMEFVPLMTQEEEEKLNAEFVPETLPILPLRNTVLFPGIIIPITVGRDKSISLIKDAYGGNKIIGVVAQKDDKIESPTGDDIHKVGTVARILKMLKMPEGNITVIIQGKRRFEIEEIIQTDPYLVAKIYPLKYTQVPHDEKFRALVSSIRDLATQIIMLSPHIPSEASIAIKNIESPFFLINFIASNINAPVSEKQNLLEEVDIITRAEKVLKLLTMEHQMLQMKQEIQNKVKSDIDRQQREYFLNQQLKQIQEELGGTPQELEIKAFQEKAAKKKWPAYAKERFEKEIEKLQRMNPAAAEYSIQINYIETLLDLPWYEYTKDNFNLKRAQKILDRDHYGLEKVKERIIEHLAVLKLKKDMKAPILCLFGPPGVGKTSLGRSIAEALGRKYVRMSLGGLHDEAEIRGHRKTYIGAMPGRIIQNIKKAGSSNPVFILDEIDKLGRDIHGDPSSALLEVLDPEQNKTFYDNFLELEYDLSRVLFIATANNLSTIQPALLDRMEVIEINGYTVEEKTEIAIRHLIPKLLQEHGLRNKEVTIPKPTIEKVINEHTRESGVRMLEKKLAKLVRNRAKLKAMEKEFNKTITVDEVEKILGPGHSQDKYQGNDVAGVVTGLAWTPAGGDILFVEVSLSPGKGNLTITGNLGDVMKESATIALHYFKSKAHEFGINSDTFGKWDVHIHVPEGAIPKDGPSAGITMLTAIASAFTQRKVKEKLAMTGEITLRGRVLAVGGIKEKILAAKRAGIKEIILSVDNKKDVEEINPVYLQGLQFTYVKHMDEVLKKALLKEQVMSPLQLQ